MALKHEVIPHASGWAVLIVPPAGAFASKEVAYAVAIEYARRLQCPGQSIRVHVQHEHEMPTYEQH